MIFGSVCSGISSASVAWKPLGWRPRFFADIDPFASAVLKHHYPEVPNLGDFTGIGDDAGPIDLLLGGTPCQSFSLAGRRGGIGDDRGNLALEFCRLAFRLRPRWVLWENVPGALSSGDPKGEDFACLLAGLSGVDVFPPPGGWGGAGILVGLPGRYSVAWRVLDSQYFGVPQRRHRVFVVGHSGGWSGPASVLLEPNCLRRRPGAGRTPTPSRPPRAPVGYGVLGRDVAFALNANGSSGGNRIDLTVETFVVDPFGVRGLTPVERERLQGFPDNYTRIPWLGKPADRCPDGLRFRAVGNSAPVPVLRWIGSRIDRYQNEVTRCLN